MRLSASNGEFLRQGQGPVHFLAGSALQVVVQRPGSAQVNAQLPPGQLKVHVALFLHAI